jgi:inner membrane protein
MDEISSLPFGINFRSMGMKLIVVCTLALFMTIPALFVGALIRERTGRSADVVQEISGHVGGQQTFPCLRLQPASGFIPRNTFW